MESLEKKGCSVVDMEEKGYVHSLMHTIWANKGKVALAVTASAALAGSYLASL